jgi:glycosyltransferase involved in cell wall biosynthesis
MATLSVITITLNEERNITDCLRSVTWADEIIVVDSGSTDRTVELARQFTRRVYGVEWKGYGAARNHALELATGEWILWLDADERVPDRLADEIRRIIGIEDHTVSGYSVARRAYFLGRWIRHCGWYPSRVTRLFRRTRGKFNERRVHESIMVDGRIERLNNDLLHHTDPSLYHYFTKFNRYTSLAAEDMKSSGITFSLSDILLRPPYVFLKMYVLRLGFLDGMHGLILSLVSSAYVFVKYTKLWELCRSSS